MKEETKKEQYKCQHLVGDLKYSYGKPNNFCPKCGLKISKKLKIDFIKHYLYLEPDSVVAKEELKIITNKQ
jgi:hypothetical protein